MAAAASSLWGSAAREQPMSPSSPWGGSAVYNQDGPPRRWLEATGILQDVEVAGRLLSDTLSRDERGLGCDLYDALDAGRLTNIRFTSPPREVRLAE